MAWIESHQALLTHRKTLRAATALGVDPVQLIGHLHVLWWWGLDNADDDGRIGDSTPEEIAAAARWSGAADAFVQALLKAGRPHGFLESKRGSFWIHDWWEFAGKYNAKRAANRARMKQARATHVQGLPTNLPTYQQDLPTSTTNQPTAAQVLAGRPETFKLYEQLFGKGVTPLVAERLMEYEQSHSPECIRHCFQEAAEGNARSVRLVYSILDRHKQEGCIDNRRRPANGVHHSEPDSAVEAPDHPYGDMRPKFVSPRRRLLDAGGGSDG